MRLRFLAGAGPADALEQLKQRIRSATGDGLLQVSDGGSLIVWAVPGTPVIYDTGRGAVLVGLLFDRTSGGRLTVLSGAEPVQRILADRWGAYALLAGEGRTHWVLRDPSGAVPVYYGAPGGVHLYASDAGLLEMAWPEPFRADLDFIRHWLTFPFLRTWRTGAVGVRELLPGTCRRVEPGRTEIVETWSPFSHTGRDSAISSFGEAAALLREEVLRTIPPLAAAAGDVALQLSGGLDSSIVAAALGHAGIPFRAITFATLAGDGDERRYAREMAMRCQVELVELTEDSSRLDLDVASSNPLRPPPNPLLQPLHRAIAVQAAHLGADTVLDGAGGDNIFAYLNTAAPAVDALRANGIAAAIAVLREIAEVHGCTFWAAARSAFRRLRRGAASRWPRETSFLAPGAALAAHDPHPWLSTSRPLLPGTADHLRMIVGIHHFLADPTPIAPAALHPLLAQPLLELCLRVPSWLWVTGGRDRAVAREAFKGLAPDAILERRGKGRLESMLMKGYMRARPELERFLADGRLAAAGIVDAAAVTAYLRQPRGPTDLGYVRLLEVAAAEQWLRSFGR